MKYEEPKIEILPFSLDVISTSGPTKSRDGDQSGGDNSGKF